MRLSVEHRIQHQLAAGERLVWCGRPGGGIRFQRDDVLMIPFMLVWAGVPVYGIGGELARGDSLRAAVFVMWLALVLFGSVGSYILIGRFLVDADRRSKTIYGLTDRRALIIGGLLCLKQGPLITGGLFRQKVVSLPLPRMTNVVLREGRKRRGTVVFAEVSWGNGGNAACTPAFVMIDDARHVYNLIEDARASQREACP